MDIHEILEIFEVSNVSNITGEGNIAGEGSEDLGSIALVQRVFYVPRMKMWKTPTIH